MKLLRYGPSGSERPGLLDGGGRIRDLSQIIPDLAGDVLSAEGLDRLRGLEPDTLPRVAGEPRIGPCVGRVPKFIGIGLNYRDHAEEAGMPIPTEPVLFMKATSCICGPNDDVMRPAGSLKLDYEVELGVVIGTVARYVGTEQAFEHVAGYCVCNDVSERGFQLDGSGQWVKGKSADTFGPIGPWLVSADEIADPQALDLYLHVNESQRQRGNTRTMIFGVAELVSYLSRHLTLEPGDIICTGTPPGVGLGRKPPRYLDDGDVVRLGIAGLGEQRQRIVACAR